MGAEERAGGGRQKIERRGATESGSRGSLHSLKRLLTLVRQTKRCDRRAYTVSSDGVVFPDRLVTASSCCTFASVHLRDAVGIFPLKVRDLSRKPVG